MQIIPNQICEGIGEIPLIEKIAPYIAQARQWWQANISENITEEDTTDSPPPGSDKEIIQSYALWLAAPMLDCTMHPNGLAVVRTDSLVPASAERTKEFRAAIMRHIIESLDPIIREKSTDPKWRNSAPAQRNWYTTTFHTPADIIRATGCPHDWDILTAAITILRTAEEADAPRVWSHEMLHTLRNAHGRETKATIYAQLIHIIQESARLYCANAEAAVGPEAGSQNSAKAEAAGRNVMLAGPALRLRQIKQLHDRYINICLAHPLATREWHRSATSQLYINPPAFRNEKKSSGYFF